LFRLTKKVQEISSCWDGRPFGHNIYGPKSGGGLLCPFRGGAGSPSNTMSLGPSLRGLSLYQLTKWHLDPFNHFDNTPTLQTDMTVP